MNIQYVFSCLLTIALALLLTGCGGGGGGSPLSTAGPASPVQASTTFADANGGTLTVNSGPLAGTQVFVPAGAMEAGTTLSISTTSDLAIAPTGIERVGPAVEFRAVRPGGQEYTTFDNGLSVSLRIPFVRSEVEANGGILNDAMLLIAGIGGTDPSRLNFSELVGSDLVVSATSHFSVVQLHRQISGGTGSNISSMTPTDSNIAGGGSFTIYGNGFINPVYLTFGGVHAADAHADTSGIIRGTIPPANGGNSDVVLSTVLGTDTYFGFSYTGANSVSIAHILPDRGPTTGTTVSIHGSGFSDGPISVLFGATSATNINIVSDNQLTCDTPTSPAAGSVDVTVVNVSSSKTRQGGFTYEVLVPGDPLRPSDFPSFGSYSTAAEAATAIAGRYAIASYTSQTNMMTVDDHVLVVDEVAETMRIETEAGATIIEYPWAGNLVLAPGRLQLTASFGAASEYYLDFQNGRGYIRGWIDDEGDRAIFDNAYREVDLNVPIFFADHEGDYFFQNGTDSYRLEIVNSGAVNIYRGGAPYRNYQWDGDYDWIWGVPNDSTAASYAVSREKSDGYELRIGEFDSSSIINTVNLFFDKRWRSSELRKVTIGFSTVLTPANAEEPAPAMVSNLPDFFSLYQGTYYSISKPTNLQGDTSPPVTFGSDERVEIIVKNSGVVTIKGVDFAWDPNTDGWAAAGSANRLTLNADDYQIVILVDTDFNDDFQVTLIQVRTGANGFPASFTQFEMPLK